MSVMMRRSMSRDSQSVPKKKKTGFAQQTTAEPPRRKLLRLASIREVGSVLIDSPFFLPQKLDAESPFFWNMKVAMLRDTNQHIGVRVLLGTTVSGSCLRW